MKKNTKEIGNELEDYIVAKLQGIEPKCRRTKGSGNRGEEGDIKSNIFTIECKKKNTSSITVNRDVWIKLLGENTSGNKLPLYILENKHDERFVVMDCEDFFKLIYEWFDNKEIVESELLKFNDTE